MITTGQAPTRAAVLELQNEQEVVNEAYVFLDEKRLLLASELLRQMAIYQELEKQLKAKHCKAKDAIKAAVMHHGLDGLEVYPAASLDAAEYQQSTRNFMGVVLVETGLNVDKASESHKPASNPSHEAEFCRKQFSELLLQNATLAGVSGNLYRLLAEYRITERRSRALENVILPEIAQVLSEMTSHLEEVDLEDAIRVRLQSRETLGFSHA